MTTTVASIHEAAQLLLDTAEAALQTTAAGFTGEAYLSPGQPSFDTQCDFVCVWQSGLALAPSGIIPQSQLMRTGPRVDLVTLNVTNGRCLTVNAPMGVPPFTAQTADAVIHMEDAQALWVGISDALADGLLDGTCKQITLQGMTAYTPQGGVGGWNLVLVVQIDGYPVP